MPLPPKDPDYFDKVNYVIDSWAQPCEAPWYIYIETLKPALLEAFIILITFGWADVVRGRFRPKGLGRRSGKRKGRWAKRLPRFPEIGNTLGKLIPIGEQIEDFGSDGPKRRFLWRIDNVIQGALFYWLVADVTIDFAFNWTSLLYKTEWCKASSLGRFAYHNVPGVNRSAGSWHKMAMTTLDYTFAPLGWSGFVGISGPTGCSVIASVAWENLPPFADVSEGQVKIYDPDSDVVYGETEKVPAPVNGNLDVPMRATVPPNRLFAVAEKHGPSWARVTAGVCTAIQVQP